MVNTLLTMQQRRKLFKKSIAHFYLFFVTVIV